MARLFTADPMFGRFATLAGVTAKHPEAGRLPFAVVRNPFAVRGSWDLHAVRDLEADVGRARDRLLRTWGRLYGPDAGAVEWITDYAGYSAAPDPGRARPRIDALRIHEDARRVVQRQRRV